MKKWTVLLLIALMAAGCSKRTSRDDDVVNGLATTTAVNPNCLNTGTFNNNLYNNGTCGLPTNWNFNNGYMSYPTTQTGFYHGYDNGYINGFDQCPYGTFRAYGATAGGLACVPISHLQTQHQAQYAVWYWDPYVYDFSFYGYYDYHNLSYFESDPYYVLGYGGYDDGYGGGCGGYGGIDVFGISICGNINISF